MIDETDKPLYQDMKSQILMTRYKEQAAHLRDLNQVDLRFFGGFLTIQLVMAGWFAAHPSSIFVAIGIFLIDLALLAVCIKIMTANRRRRHEIRDTIININEAFGLYTPGIYLPEKPINPPRPKAASLIWLELGCCVGVLGVFIVLFAPFVNQAAPMLALWKTVALWKEVGLLSAVFGAGVSCCISALSGLRHPSQSSAPMKT